MIDVYNEKIKKKITIPFKKKCKRGKSYGGNDITINNKNIMTHSLIESIHGENIHASRTKLQAYY